MTAVRISSYPASAKTRKQRSSASILHIALFKGSTHRSVDSGDAGAFDIVIEAERLIYADWRIRKIVSAKNKMHLSTTDIAFKDFYFKKRMLWLMAESNLHPFGQILHRVNQKIYFISHDSQLVQLDVQSMKCELLPFRSLESIQSHKNTLVGVSNEGSLFLMKHIPNRAPTTLRISIKRDFCFMKVAVHDDHVVVHGWSEERKEAIYLLYDSRLLFKDEVIFEQSTSR